ncbi:hypothetical protein [Nostoc sp. JL23]|uniref:hypothetical protein n=1 Tax=Nostoc sp. JL23 TaxID=2815394 RepID=UPI001D698021|nr:hypothetical protein [Nostoc sp. JL23]MBN3875186.1 hypothetical protein [Nostoc sp. JL23]
MFIETNNKDGHRILINTDAIAYVEFEAQILILDPKRPEKESGVRIWFQATIGGEKSCWLANQEFAGKEAENLRGGLSKILGAHNFSA